MTSQLPHRMRVMLVESDVGSGEEFRDGWTRRGHAVVSCNDEDGGPCRSVSRPSECPLRAHVDLAVLVSSESTTSGLNEMGFVCAKRHRVPTMTIDPEVADEESGLIESQATVARRRVEAAYAEAVQRRLPPGAATVSVHRLERRIVVDLCQADHDTDPHRRSFLADLARDAVRNHDPYVDVIDVCVTTAPTLVV